VGAFVTAAVITGSFHKESFYKGSFYNGFYLRSFCSATAIGHVHKIPCRKETPIRNLGSKGKIKLDSAWFMYGTSRYPCNGVTTNRQFINCASNGKSIYGSFITERAPWTSGSSMSCFLIKVL